MSNAQPDPCEWFPEENRALYWNEKPHAEATVIIGRDGRWRLCDSCSRLHIFSRYKKRKEIIHG